MEIIFTDNRMQIINAINSNMVAFLYETGETIASQAADNSRVDTGDLKNKWTYIVDESKPEVIIGNPLQNAIWEEFGTGEYALKQNGRKGYWVFIKGDESQSTNTGGKQYTLQEAKRAVAYLRSKGLDAYYTKGKTPNRALWYAWELFKPYIVYRFRSIMRGGIDQ